MKVSLAVIIAVFPGVEAEGCEETVAEIADVTLGGGGGNFESCCQGFGIGKAAPTGFLVEEEYPLKKTHAPITWRAGDV